LPVTNPFKCNVIRAIWRDGQKPIYRIDSFHDDKASADRREIELIAAIGRLRDGGPLTNLTAGGEGGLDPSPEAKEKHRQTLGGDPGGDGDRAKVNRILKTFEPNRGSIAIKPITEFTPYALTAFTSSEKRVTVGSLTERCAVVLAVSAIANGIRLRDNCKIPRHMLLDDVEAAIENGVARRILASGTCTIDPSSSAGKEIFVLQRAAIASIISAVGRTKLEAAGVLD